MTRSALAICYRNEVLHLTIFTISQHICVCEFDDHIPYVFLPFCRVEASLSRTRSLPTRTQVCGSQVKATPPSRTTISTEECKGACTSSQMGVVCWRRTISMATRWPGYRSEQGATLSLGTTRFIMGCMEAFMW